MDDLLYIYNEIFHNKFNLKMKVYKTVFNKILFILKLWWYWLLTYVTWYSWVSQTHDSEIKVSPYRLKLLLFMLSSKCNFLFLIIEQYAFRLFIFECICVYKWLNFVLTSWDKLLLSLSNITTASTNEMLDTFVINLVRNNFFK